MSRDDIIKLARDAGIDFQQHKGPSGGWNVTTRGSQTIEKMERFAALVAAEREDCALAAEDSDHVVQGRGYYDQLGDADATARNIASAIRARGQS